MLFYFICVCTFHLIDFLISTLVLFERVLISCNDFVFLTQFQSIKTLIYLSRIIQSIVHVLPIDIIISLLQVYGRIEQLLSNRSIESDELVQVDLQEIVSFASD